MLASGIFAATFFTPPLARPLSYRLMALQPWYSDEQAQKSGFSKRAVAAAVVVLGMLLVLILQLIQLQIIEHENYITRSDNNRLNTEPATPARGRIFSRNGLILADNHITYQLALTPNKVDDLLDTVWQLMEFVSITEEDAIQYAKNLKLGSRYSPVVLKSRLTETEIATILARQHQFPGVSIEQTLSRVYPHGSLAGHAIGYVSPIDLKDIKRVDPVQYEGTQVIGKRGIEYRYENQLHGLVGRELVEINAIGRKLNTLEYDAPVAGADLYLTIDLGLQQATKAAFEALEEPLNGAAVAIEPSTGDVLALVNHPNFDPRVFLTGTKQQKDDLSSDENKPQFNRAVQGQYPPGSTLKPFVALAGLHYGEVQKKPEYCRGFVQVGNDPHKFRDWKRSGHGAVDLNLAMAQSCDVFFYEVSRRLGIDRMRTMLTQFNFSHKTGIDLVGEERGLIPSRPWKQRYFGQKWLLGETLIAGIGQGYVKTTPLQLAHATATLANRGTVIAPRLVRAIQPYANLNSATGNTLERKKIPQLKNLQPKIVRTIDIAPEHWQAVINGMVSVVHSRQGTAKRLGVDLPFIMAGKTGTAQVKALAQRGDNYQHELEELKHRDHALFIAFAPVENPKIAVAVIVEHGGSGGKIAGPIARTMVTHWLAQEQVEDATVASAAISNAAIETAQPTSAEAVQP